MKTIHISNDTLMGMIQETYLRIVKEQLRESAESKRKEAGLNKKKNRNRDAFDDAVDYISSGLGFRAWRERYEDIEPLEAENIYSDAESYCRMMRKNDEEYNIKPDSSGRYPDENLNILDKKGIEGIRALGGGGSRFRSIKALRAGGMGMEDAFKEYDRLRESENRKRRLTKKSLV